MNILNIIHVKFVCTSSTLYKRTYDVNKFIRNEQNTLRFSFTINYVPLVRIAQFLLLYMLALVYDLIIYWIVLSSSGALGQNSEL